MQRSSTLYTLGFAAAVCVVCSILVSGAAVALKSRQQQNVLLDRQFQVLAVAGVIEPGDSLSRGAIQQRFADNIEIHVVDLESGAIADDAVEGAVDMVAMAKDPEQSQPAPENKAGVLRIPKYASVHQVVKDNEVEMYILQVWGQGLWSTMYGYIAIDRDCNTIQGLTFYEQGETPGLGGEVDNPKWKSCWPGRKAFDENGEPALVAVKGGAGSVEEDPHGFDAISGATITSRSVQYLLNFWLGDAGYGPYLEQCRTNKG